MGQNADDAFCEIGYTPIRSLRVTAFGEVYRKGGTMPIADEYANDQGRVSFMFGPLHIERSFGFTAVYEPLRDLFFNAKARLSRIQDEIDPAQNRAHEFEVTLGAGVGIW
jgi:hypothetical protein